MRTQPEALRLALEALENCASEHGHRCNRCDSEVDEGGKVVAALRAALAQQDEPVWMHPWPPVRAQQAEPQTIDEAMQQPRSMTQAYENGYKAGVAAEREACAQVCEQMPELEHGWRVTLPSDCAAAIRARGEQP